MRLYKHTKDETGNRYGRLTVVRPYAATSDGVYWLCKCDCGTEFAALGVRLRAGGTRSCGCLRQMKRKKRLELGFVPYGKERVLREQ